MSSTDDRIVKMQFDNAQFKRGAAETQSALGSLDKAVATSGKGRGLLDLGKAMGAVGSSASAMAVVTTTALATIANKVTNVGLHLANSLTFSPLKQGFSEYESMLTKQNTIMNSTGQSAQVVKGILNQLNKYSDKTIYSFGDMTNAITKFTNAGVPLKTAVTSIKGIANSAAFAGASSEEASRGMIAFSQAIGTGYMGLMDWTQVENANMGTKKFKEQLIAAAVATGSLTKKGNEYITKSGKAITSTKGWRDGLQEQWLTSKALNKALGEYADTTTTLGKKSFKAAQDVRTFSAFMDTLKESIGSGWSNIFTSLFGNLKQATKFWTGMSNAIGGVVQGFFGWLSIALKVWRTMGGFHKTMEGFHNLFAPIVALFKVFRDAWQLAFPTGKKGPGEFLYSMSEGFAKITKPLADFAEWMPKITPYLAEFFKIIGSGGHGLGELAGKIGELVKSFVSLGSAKGLNKFFDKLGKGLPDLAEVGKDAAGHLLDGLADGFNGANFETILGGLTVGLLAMILKKLKDGIGIDITGGVTKKISESFGAVTKSLSVMQTSLKAKTLASIAIAIGMLTASIVVLSFIDGKALLKSMGAIGLGLTVLLGAMLVLTKLAGKGGFITLPLLAGAMVLLGTAVLILTGALVALSFLSYEDIGKGLATISLMIGGIALAMKLMPKTLPITAAGLVLVSLALIGITGAIAGLSLLSYESLAKGIGAISLAIAGIALAMKLMPLTLPITAAGLVLIGVALNLIAGAMALMSLLSWESIAKGIAGISLAIAGIALAMKLMPKTLPITAAGLVLVGVALNLIGGAMKIMGGMSWEEIAKGLVGIGGAIAILAIGLNAMKGGAILGAAALIVAALAIGIMTPALIALGSMSWEEIAKAMVGLAGGLTILGIAAALFGNPVVLLGALAMLMMAPALLAMGAALKMIGSLSWEQLAVGLVGLAAGFVVIGVAGVLLAPVVPVFIGLGLAMLAFGVGLYFAAKAITEFMKNINLIIDVGKQLIGGLVAGISSAAGKLWGFLTGIFGKVIDFVKGIFGIASPSKVFADIGKFLIMGFINGLKSVGGLIWNFLKWLFEGIIGNVLDIVTGFIKIGSWIVKNLINGVKILFGLLPSKIQELIMNVLDKAKEKLGDFKDIGINMVKGIIDGVKEMGQDALNAIGNLAKGMVDKAKGLLKIFSPSKVFMSIGKFLVLGLTEGIQNNAASAIVAVASMVGGQIAVASQYINKFIQDLDQQAISARAKADGLASAAEKASKAAQKTKTKSDDKAAEKLSNKADKADKAAAQAEAKAEKAKERAERNEEFKNADSAEKAKMRAEDAQFELDAAKEAERRAAAARAEANALDKQSKAKGVSPEERKKLQKEADRLRKQAAADAKNANVHFEEAKTAMGSALIWQAKAGAEAAAAFQAAFDADAKAVADEAAFNKMSNEEKAAFKKKEADDLKIKSEADLAKAKKLAYTDLEAANELAKKAIEEADAARKALEESQKYATGDAGATGGSGGSIGTVVNLAPTDAAAIAMQDRSDLYSSATAAAATSKTVEFNQYNSSPESLSPSEVYRQSKNLFTYAVEKLDEVA